VITLRTSDKGLELIKKYEGCKLVVYLDPIGIPTVGYGHTKGLTKGMVGKRISQAEADNFLRQDLVVAEKAVSGLKLPLNQNQFDALVSFAFNCGTGNLKKLCSGRTITQIGNAIPLYNKAGGKVLTGLTRRRNSEKQLYFSIAEEIPTNDVNPYKCPKSGVLKLGSKGIGVKWLQWELNKHGALLMVDGFFGKKTETALINYQRKAKIKIDGMAGAETRKSLNAN
jgi:GH24 family phage-related lysozyme (muramidase)